jgi:8-amino-7-oxononanoate synthase
LNRQRQDLIQRMAFARAQKEREDLLRRVRTVHAQSDTQIVVDGRRLTHFASNDYLGLARHPELVEALQQAARDHGVGASAAHLLGGHREHHAELEESLARWTGRERALLFSTGYMANIGVMQALLGRDDLCVQDKLNHACLIDGAQLSGAQLRRYPHADVDGARRQLQTRADAPALLATDGVFSMDGDVAPLSELADLCASEGACLMVDDAHGIGVLGTEGAGSLVESGLGEHEAPILMATLGKALGVSGAFVAGSARLIDGLVQFARTHIYTTAQPPALAAATSVAVRIAREEQWRRDRLVQLIAQFRHGAEQRGLLLAPSRTPIQPVLVGRSAAAVQASRQLEGLGFFVPAIRPPTVPENSARLRVTLSAAHQESEVERLLDALALSLRPAESGNA